MQQLRQFLFIKTEFGFLTRDVDLQEAADRMAGPGRLPVDLLPVVSNCPHPGSGGQRGQEFTLLD